MHETHRMNMSHRAGHLTHPFKHLRQRQGPCAFVGLLALIVESAPVASLGQQVALAWLGRESKELHPQQSVTSDGCRHAVGGGQQRALITFGWSSCAQKVTSFRRREASAGLTLFVITFFATTLTFQFCTSHRYTAPNAPLPISLPKVT